MKVYKKNRLDKFWIPLYRRLSWWIILTIILASIIYLLIWTIEKFNSLNYFHLPTEQIFILLYINICLIGILISIKIYRFLKKIKQVGNIRYYFSSMQIARNIKQNFIDSMLVNRAIQTLRIKVPDVIVDFSQFEHFKTIKVIVERLANVDDMDKVATSVSNAMGGKYKDYAVTISIDNPNKKDFTLIAEDVNKDLRLVPRTPEELVGTTNDDYIYNLQKGVTWTLSHGLISGRSGSGKSTVLYSLLMQMLEKELHENIYIIDPKNEFNSLLGLINNIAVTKDQALELLEKVVSEMEQREEKVKEFNRSNNSFGATARDAGIKPTILIVDEASSMSASFTESKERKLYENQLMKIVQRGRSASVFQLQSLQVASTDFLPSAIRNNLSLRILVGSPTAVDIQFMFGTGYQDLSSPVGNNGQYDFTGYYYMDGLPQPLKFFIPDIKTHELTDTSKLKRLKSPSNN